MHPTIEAFIAGGANSPMTHTDIIETSARKAERKVYDAMTWILYAACFSAVCWVALAMWVLR
jgi:hypothetical protein